ncbi:MAG: histidine phosphatase family protein [Lachnospiraceae bacterium]|nr:histidine phosphatase family protein [Lachnospiraceae bacterium]
MVIFYVVRHGQTLLNLLNRAQGWSDSPLTKMGEQTAMDLGRKLTEVNFDFVYTSDMPRAIRTAELILSVQKNPVPQIKTDKRLREWCLGSLEAEYNSVFTKRIAEWLGGLSSIEELNKRLPDVAAAIYQNDTTGMAEPFSDIVSRLNSIFTEISRKNCKQKDYNVLMVTHAFTMKTLLYLFAREQLCQMSKIDNGAILRLTYNDESFSLEQI